MDALIDSINRLLIGLDNLSVVANAASTEFTTATSTVTDILETTGANLLVSIGHLSSVMETAASNITKQIGAFIEALDPKANPILNALPTAPALHAREVKEAIPTAQAAGGPAGGSGLGGVGAIEAIGKGATAVGAAAAQAGTRLGSLTAPLGIFGSVVSGIAPMLGPLGPLAGAAGEALSKVTQSFERVVGVMGQFAEATAPNIMWEFNRALKDLSATVGIAFVPFFNSMVAITRQVAGELYPAMQALQPVFASMAEVVGGILVPVANLFGDVLKTLIPAFTLTGTIVKLVGDLLFSVLSPVIGLFAQLGALQATLLEPIARLIGVALTLGQAFNPVLIGIQLLGGIIGGVAKLFGALLEVLSPFISVLETVASYVQTAFSVIGAIFSATLTTVIDLFKALIPAIDLKPVFDFLRNAFLQVAKVLIQFAVQVAALFGNTGFADNLVKSLKGLAGAPGKPTGIAAPENVHTTGLEAIGKEMAEAAARAVGAGGGGAKKDTADLIAELIVAAEKAKDGQLNAIGDLKTVVSQSVDKVKEWIYGGADNIVTAIVNGAKSAVTGAAKSAYERLRDSTLAGQLAKKLF